MSCEKCGKEVKNYGVFLGGVRCADWCFALDAKRISDRIEMRTKGKKEKEQKESSGLKQLD